MSASRVKVDPETGTIKVRVDPNGLYENREQVLFASLMQLVMEYGAKYDGYVVSVIQENLDANAESTGSPFGRWTPIAS